MSCGNHRRRAEAALIFANVYITGPHFCPTGHFGAIVGRHADSQVV